MEGSDFWKLVGTGLNKMFSSPKYPNTKVSLDHLNIPYYILGTWDNDIGMDDQVDNNLPCIIILAPRRNGPAITVKHVFFRKPVNIQGILW